MRISKNFTLDEFLLSQTATRHGIDMDPPTQVISNIRDLVNGCLQPLRDEVKKPIFISSGYRPQKLNEMIGGSATSAHIRGHAADFTVVGMTPFDTCELIVVMELPFDQMIHEYGRWVHLGVGHNLRGETLTAILSNGHPRFEFGIRRLEELA